MLDSRDESLMGFVQQSPRNSDRLDFHDVAVWAIRSALTEAYAAGVAAAAKR